MIIYGKFVVIRVKQKIINLEFCGGNQLSIHDGCRALSQREPQLKLNRNENKYN